MSFQKTFAWSKAQSRSGFEIGDFISYNSTTYAKPAS